MVSQGIFLCLLMGAVRGFPHTLLLIPSEIELETPEKICMLQTTGMDSGTLRVTIYHPHSNRTLLDLQTTAAGAHGCANFTAPHVELENDWNAVALVTVTGSGEFSVINVTRKVLLRKSQSLTFVQTDKPVYKPGQTVRFRIVTLDQEFRTTEEKYPLITLWDPQTNRIGQWRDEEGRQGIVDLSFELIADSPKGNYEILVEKSSGKTTHSFSVEEYVLPKFELKVHLPERITILDKTIHLRMCGRYTYGKPMQGDINGTVCLKTFYAFSSPNLCHVVVGKTGADGCFSTDLSTDLFRLKRNWNRGSIHAHFVLDEEGTGIRREQDADCSIAREITQTKFEEVEDYYRKGIPYSGKVVIKYATGRPLSGAKLYLFNSIVPGAQEVVTDEHGTANFSFDTTKWENEAVTLMAIYQIQAEDMGYYNRIPGHFPARHNVKPFYSRSGSFMSIAKDQRELPCEWDLQLPVSYIIKGLPVNGHIDIEVFQLVMSRGKIVSFEKTVQLVGAMEAEGTFHLVQRINQDLTPVTEILVFTVLPDGEMIGDVARFTVSKCFRNKVHLRFSSPEDLPGTPISLDLQADSGSLCALRVVDQSVLLLKPEKELSVDSVYGLLPTYGASQYLLEENAQQFCRPKAGGFWPGISERDSVFDVARLLQNMGLKILTDLHYHVPLNCEHEMPNYQRFHYGIPGSAALPDVQMAFLDADGANMQPMVGVSVPSPTQKLREYFPETWLWDLIPVSTTGHGSLEVTVPDSVTEWKGNMFCSGETGFGMSETASFTAFKPFFVELALPYSVIRTEGFTLKAKVFNYMDHSLMVKVTLLEAQGFELKSAKSEAETCVVSKDSFTVSWNLIATSLGEVNITVRAESVPSDTLCGNEVVTVPLKGAVDIVRKPLLIQAEGLETDLSHSNLFCPAGNTITEKIHLQVPENVVQGSARASVTVLGDIMGSAMENLDHLLALPTGCGEQNMVKFAPNIYVLSYLEKTHQLTPEIKSKAVGFLRTGYQRELNYKHNDGSYSAFGSSDTEGNTWLTAFVLKSFLHAQSYIFIDDIVLHQAATFFLKYRMESGCFASLGHLFNNAMKGGVDDHISLSAYVTTALLELLRLNPKMASEVYDSIRKEQKGDNDLEWILEELNLTTLAPVHSDFKSAVIDVSLGCLREALKTVNSTYTLALLAYTFTLAGDHSSREITLQKLQEHAVNKDGLTHWQREGSPEEELEEHWGFWARAPSAEVEMTSYVLLAMISKSPLTPSDLEQVTPIVRWLIRQRNSYGGFASTQDTVVALHALSLYGGLTHSTDPQGLVTMSGEGGFQREFRLDASNQLLLQRESLEQIPGEYSVLVSGSSCLLLETTLRYNTPPAPSVSAFRLSADLETDDHGQAVGKIHINVTFTGTRNVSNMVIVDVKMLSGYSADLNQNKNIHPSISKLEIENGHLVMYIQEMEAFWTLRMTVNIHQDFVVANLQPAFVKVYDYYETGDSAVAEYHHPHPTKIQ